jgi:hypothetical protein
MTLPLDKEILAAAYDFLRTTPPFRTWNLPEAEDVKFKVVRTRRNYGRYLLANGTHTIEVSSGAVGHTTTLMTTLAHEMIHLHEWHANANRTGGEHTAAFKKWAAQVCRVHGFDPKWF